VSYVCYLIAKMHIFCDRWMNEWMNEYGILVDWHWQVNTEVLGEKPAWSHFVHTQKKKNHIDWPGFESGPSHWEYIEVYHGLLVCAWLFTLLVPHVLKTWAESINGQFVLHRMSRVKECSTFTLPDKLIVWLIDWVLWSWYLEGGGSTFLWNVDIW